jgi:hypothetical protein
VVSAKSAATAERGRHKTDEEQRVSQTHLWVYQKIIVTRNGGCSRCGPLYMAGTLGVSGLYTLPGCRKRQDDGMMEDVRPSKDLGTMEA